MSPIVATAIVLAFIALGEIASLRSRARVPALLVAMLGLFVFAKAGVIPSHVVDTSTMATFGALVIPALMVHMGSLIPLQVLKLQWRAVLISVGGMVVGVGLVMAIVPLIFGLESAIGGSGPLAGGIVATVLTTDGLAAQGVAGSIAVIPVMVLIFQSLPSMPLTNLLLRRYALDLVDGGKLDLSEPGGGAPGQEPAPGSDAPPARRQTLIRLPESLASNDLVLLFLVVAGGALATGLESLTGISYSIWGIGIGIAGTALGVYPDRVLERANSFSITMAAVIFVVVAPLITASLQDVLASVATVATILVVGMAGIVLGGWIVTKLLGWDPRLGVPVALTAMYGFPADYLLVQEVARSTGRNEAERAALRDKILPPMLIGGFTSVSAGSIVIASVLVDLL